MPSLGSLKWKLIGLICLLTLDLTTRLSLLHVVYSKLTALVLRVTKRCLLAIVK